MVMADVRLQALARTLRPHRVGADPTTLLESTHFWRATLTPDGPGTLHLDWTSGRLELETWGPGSGWLSERVGDLIGTNDHPVRFDDHSHPAVRAAQRRHGEIRLSNGHCLYHALLPTVIGQRVTAVEAFRSWRQLCLAIGEPAPGPAPLRCPPRPDDLAARPYWWFHPLGIDRRRADTLRALAAHAHRLFACDDSTPAEAASVVSRLPGIGAWTIGASFAHALGDPDAVAVGDYHLKNTVAYALAGRARGTDAEMVELLAPYAGHRARVLALLAADGWAAPRYGPRQRILPTQRW
jgi:3-methyladenine DNA glycosylase/8-oxoguanine DNA glycosylase